MNRIVLAAVALLITTFISTAPANAQPLPGCTGPPVGPIPATVWCYPPVPSGQHLRCEWKVFINACDWRWSDNSIAPPA